MGNVDLGFYLHIEGPVSPPNKANTICLAEKSEDVKNNLRVPLSLSEGVPHEVFGPWVRWGRGQVISDLSRRRHPPPPIKNDIGTLGHK